MIGVASVDRLRQGLVDADDDDDHLALLARRAIRGVAPWSGLASSITCITVQDSVKSGVRGALDREVVEAAHRVALRA